MEKVFCKYCKHCTVTAVEKYCSIKNTYTVPANFYAPEHQEPGLIRCSIRNILNNCPYFCKK